MFVMLWLAFTLLAATAMRQASSAPHSAYSLVSHVSS
jgi:hypothetical protein